MVESRTEATKVKRKKKNSLDLRVGEHFWYEGGEYVVVDEDLTGVVAQLKDRLELEEEPALLFLGEIVEVE